MSGPLSVPFVLLAFVVSSHWQKVLYGVLAVLCATIASYRVWRKDRLEAGAQLDALKTTIADQRRELADRDEKIKALMERPKRSAAEQHDYDKLKKALGMFKETGQVALQYIRSVGNIAFDSTWSPTLPSGLTVDKALWVYQHCATEGLLNCTSNLGNTTRTFSIPPKLEKIYDEVLFPES